MRFTKMQGCGNDYIYVDCFAQPEPPNAGELSKRMSDRHFGVGSDGLILILPSKVADARMRMFNRDGSEGEMCGNGIRCVAKFLFDRGIVKQTQITVETNRGTLPLECAVENSAVKTVRVDMGEPILDSRRIPTTFESDKVVDAWMPYWTEARAIPDLLNDNGGGKFQATCLSIGNPHAVFFCNDVTEVPLDSIGPIIECAPVFPKKANVHFAMTRTRNEVMMRTWERGSGITLACGTGACAVCVAGVLTNRTERQILAHLPGGDLQLDWSEEDNHVYMTGPAVEVFSGEWPD